jgi:hypothetical protein
LRVTASGGCFLALFFRITAKTNGMLRIAECLPACSTSLTLGKLRRVLRRLAHTCIENKNLYNSYTMNCKFY